MNSPASISLIGKNSARSQSGRLWQQFVRAHVRVKDLYDTFDECQQKCSGVVLEKNKNVQGLFW